VNPSEFSLCRSSSSDSPSSFGDNSSVSNKDRRSKRKRKKRNSHPISTFTIDEKDLQRVRAISEGSFGVVYLGTYMEKEVAIKVFKKKDKKLNMENFLKEVEILSGLKHKNVILYMGVCITDSQYMIITE
jgi:hypothetical protein